MQIQPNTHTCTLCADVDDNQTLNKLARTHTHTYTGIRVRRYRGTAIRLLRSIKAPHKYPSRRDRQAPLLHTACKRSYQKLIVKYSRELWSRRKQLSRLDKRTIFALFGCFASVPRVCAELLWTRPLRVHYSTTSIYFSGKSAANIWRGFLCKLEFPDGKLKHLSDEWE